MCFLDSKLSTIDLPFPDPVTFPLFIHSLLFTQLVDL